MITRNLSRGLRFGLPQTTISTRFSSSAAGAPPNSQHPHAQLGDTAKLDSINSQGPQDPSLSSQSTTPTGENLPSNAILIRDPEYSEPHITPFHTYKFFTALEQTFPTPIARTLMRSTRGLLVDRILRIRRDALDLKDLDNQAYLFRAALSELRTEATLRTKNQAATITTAVQSLRRDVDKLDVKMKEDIGDLKHEIQMEMDNHRNESRAESKTLDIKLEDMTHNAFVTIGNIRTGIEQAKWDNTRRGVAIFASFVLFIIISMELTSSPKPSYPPKEAAEAADTIDVTSTT
ncbi:hypothetical protein FRB91_008984 [Serendipita sp. 411]|nr:hypothetical protein FRB91_008984 [Serendipita sp. 411]